MGILEKIRNFVGGRTKKRRTKRRGKSRKKTRGKTRKKTRRKRQKGGSGKINGIDLFNAVNTKNLEAVKKALVDDKYINEMYWTPMGSVTPLYHAVTNGYKEIIKELLLSKNLEVDKVVPHVQWPKTALALACAYEDNNTEIIKMLIEKGADINNEGENPLIAAYDNKHTANINLLLMLGAKIPENSADIDKEGLQILKNYRSEMDKKLFDNIKKKVLDDKKMSESGKTVFSLPNELVKGFLGGRKTRKSKRKTRKTRKTKRKL